MYILYSRSLILRRKLVRLTTGNELLTTSFSRTSISRNAGIRVFPLYCNIFVLVTVVKDRKLRDEKVITAYA